MDLKCGTFEVMNIMTGEHMTPEMLKVNPFHQMPNLSDGDFNLAESNAIIRYLANQYASPAQALYGGNDMKKKATIDWALDWMSTNFGKNNFPKIWYGSVGFGAPAEDQPKENAAAITNLELFESKFLCGPGPFIDGAATPTIADYVCAVKFHMLDHALIGAKTGFKLPASIKKYKDEFLSVCANKDFLKQHDGFCDSKM